MIEAQHNWRSVTPTQPMKAPLTWSKTFFKCANDPGWADMPLFGFLGRFQEGEGHIM